MPESKEENVKPENAKEVIHPSNGEAVQTSQADDKNAPKEEKSSSQDHNWREVREIMQQQKHLIAEQREEIEKLKHPKSAPPEQKDPLADLSDDDVVTVGDTKKLVAHYAVKEAQRIIEEREKKRKIEEVPSRYNDYDEVIKLADEYVKQNPAAKQAILSSPNARETAYQLIKSSQLYKDRIASKGTAEKVIENSQKPGSSQSVGTSSPLNDVSSYRKMTKEKAAEIRKLAEEYASKR